MNHELAELFPVASLCAVATISLISWFESLLAINEYVLCYKFFVCAFCDSVGSDDSSKFLI